MHQVQRELVAHIARVYSDTPDQSNVPGMREALGTYADEIQLLFDMIAIPVEFVGFDPYSCATVMKKRVLTERRLQVSTRNNAHPCLSPAVNVKARAVHDLLGHLTSGADFSIQGEATAYVTQAAFHSGAVAGVLFCEIVGQAAVQVMQGRFLEQKIVMYDECIRTQAARLSRPFAAAIGLENLIESGFVRSGVRTSHDRRGRQSVIPGVDGKGATFKVARAEPAWRS